MWERQLCLATMIAECEKKREKEKEEREREKTEASRGERMALSLPGQTDLTPRPKKKH